MNIYPGGPCVQVAVLRSVHVWLSPFQKMWLAHREGSQYLSALQRLLQSAPHHCPSSFSHYPAHYCPATLASIASMDEPEN